MSKTKSIKKETRGRKAAVINFPKRGIFTAKSLYSKHNVTLVTLQKYLKKAKEQRIITLVDKKIVDKTGRGRPILYYKYGKIKNVKISFVPKKPGRIYVPKYLKKDKIKVIEQVDEIIKVNKLNSNKPPTDFLNTDDSFAPAELDLVEV